MACRPRRSGFVRRRSWWPRARSTSSSGTVGAKRRELPRTRVGDVGTRSVGRLVALDGVDDQRPQLPHIRLHIVDTGVHVVDTSVQLGVYVVDARMVEHDPTPIVVLIAPAATRMVTRSPVDMSRPPPAPRQESVSCHRRAQLIRAAAYFRSRLQRSSEVRFRTGGATREARTLPLGTSPFMNNFHRPRIESPGSPKARRVARPVAQLARMDRLGRRAGPRLSEASDSPRRGRGEGAQEARGDEPLQCPPATARRCPRSP